MSKKTLKNHQLVIVLNTFNLNELKKFELFLESPYFKVGQRRPGCLRLFRKLFTLSIPIKGGNRDFSNIVLDKSKEPAIDVYLSHLYKALIEFIGHPSDFSKESLLGNSSLFSFFYFLEFLVRRNLNSLFLKHFKKFEKELEQAKESESLFLLRVRLKKLKINQKVNAGKAYNHDLQLMAELLSLHQTLYTLKLCCIQRNADFLNSLKQANNLLHHPVLEVVKQHSAFRQNDLIKLYYTCYQALEFPEEVFKLEYIFELNSKNEFNISEQIHPTELAVISTYIENICIRRINRGIKRADFARVLFKVFLWETEQIIEKEKTIRLRVYYNIINIAGVSKQINAGKKFIEDNTQYLPKDHREDHKKMAEAILAMVEKDFHKVIENLIEIYRKKNIIKDILLSLNCRTMEIQAYYEINRTDDSVYDILLNRIASFRRYLGGTNKAPLNQIKPYKDFLQQLIKLVNIRSSTNNKKDKLTNKIAKFKETLEKKEVPKKDWLQDKIIELEQEKNNMKQA